MIFRALRSYDRAQWGHLWAAYNAFYGREGETALSNQIVSTAWERLLDETTAIHGLVAEQDERLVGLAHFIFHPNMIQLADTCYLQDLFTTPDMRGHGVGRQLIAGVEATCRARGVEDIYWHTHLHNEVARGLYDRLARNSEFLVYRMRSD